MITNYKTNKYIDITGDSFMKWFKNYCTLSALYSFYKNYHDMHANGDITLKYETIMKI